MKLLVLDSSGLVASVALIEDDQLIAEYTTGNKLTHSQTLLPMLDEVIKRTSFEIEDIDAQECQMRFEKMRTSLLRFAQGFQWGVWARSYILHWKSMVLLCMPRR